ncbi:hypothetical protein G9A89_002200 [Geosiphon pyriformis]|nr:hypothetical protein G9A89_002200 [Geosiphon pyriformis]
MSPSNLVLPPYPLRVTNDQIMDDMKVSKTKEIFAQQCSSCKESKKYVKIFSTGVQNIEKLITSLNKVTGRFEPFNSKEKCLIFQFRINENSTHDSKETSFQCLSHDILSSCSLDDLNILVNMTTSKDLNLSLSEKKSV